MTVAAPSDDALLAAARTGERLAIETLLERYQDRVFGFGLRMCGDTEDAKDVLQDTLLAAARTVGVFRGDSSVSTWLYTIARSFCIKKRRRSKFAPVEEISLDGAALGSPSLTPGPDEMAVRDEVRRALVSALEILDPLSREVLILRDMEGLTAPEVATITGSSIDAIKSRLHRARSAVRERLAVLLGDVPERAPGCPDVLTAFSKQLEGDLESRLCGGRSVSSGMAGRNRRRPCRGSGWKRSSCAFAVFRRRPYSDQPGFGRENGARTGRLTPRSTARLAT